MKILVIDDDKLTTTMLMHYLENLGHQVSLAYGGEEALNMISDSTFDLIVSDIMMPGISGLSLVSVLRSVHLCNTPIIMMSTLNNDPLLEAAFEAGANDFIAKPFTVKDLVYKLRAYNE